MSIAVALLAFVGTCRSGGFSGTMLHWTRTVPKIVDAYPRRNVRHIIVMCFFAGEHRGLLLKPIAWPKTERTCGSRNDRVAKEGSAPTECNV